MIKTAVVALGVAVALMGCGKKEEPAARTGVRDFAEAFRECIDRNTRPDKVHAITFDSPEKLADHCNAVAEREERDIKIRAAAREKYL